MKDIRIIRSDSRSMIEIGSEQIEISDYKLQSTADGETELCIIIKGISTEFEMSTNLTEQMPIEPNKVVNTLRLST